MTSASKIESIEAWKKKVSGFTIIDIVESYFLQQKNIRLSEEIRTKWLNSEMESAGIHLLFCDRSIVSHATDHLVSVCPDHESLSKFFASRYYDLAQIQYLINRSVIGKFVFHVIKFGFVKSCVKAVKKIGRHLR
jgi:hypothetical protein